MDERRKHRRVTINKRVWICDLGEDTHPADRQDCLVVDISEGGACIQCAACFEVSQPIAFTYQDFMEEGSRPVVGMVMWSKRYSERDCRYGIKFLGLSTKMLRRIQDIVARSGEGTDVSGA